MDWWRALGVSFAVMAGSALLFVLTYPFVKEHQILFISKDVVLTIGIAIVAAYLYFRNNPGSASFHKGMYFGLVTVIPGAVMIIIFGIESAVYGDSNLAMPSLYSPVGEGTMQNFFYSIGMIGLILYTSAITANVISRKNKLKSNHE